MPAGDGGYPANSAAAAAWRMEQRALRLQSLLPLHTAIAGKMQAATDRSFQAQRSPAGEPFAPLAPSTVAARSGSQSYRKGNRGGGFLRGKASGSNVLALLKTRRMQRESKYEATATTILFKSVPYEKFHSKGNPRLPKRNVTVFETAGRARVLIPVFAGMYRAGFITFVETGEVKV